jgi:hypothetical protein
MAIAQLFFNKGNFIGSIEIDVFTNESTTSAVRATEHPVEQGANINEHVIIEPLTFSITGVVSNTKAKPLDFESAINRFSRVDTRRSTVAWDDLLFLQRQRAPFTLVTNLRTYENIIIETLTTDQDKDTSNALFFTASLRELILVGEDVSDTTFSDQNTADKATGNVSGGVKQVL